MGTILDDMTRKSFSCDSVVGEPCDCPEGVMTRAGVYCGLDMYLCETCVLQAGAGDGSSGGGVFQNGLDTDISAATKAVNELTFEEDEEEAIYMKDLPKHACT